MDKVSKRIVELREERGETQQELADAIGITRQSLSRYEIAARTINVDVLGELAKHFNVSADYLLGLTDVRSTEQDMKIACEVTGLSEKAIQNITCYYKGVTDFYASDAARALLYPDDSVDEIKERSDNALSRLKIIVSDFLESDEFTNLLEHLEAIDGRIIGIKKEYMKSRKMAEVFPSLSDIETYEDYSMIRLELLDAYEDLKQYTKKTIEVQGLIFSNGGAYFHGKHNQTEE
jgi:transcriptional regulator with XRE-family HTH domain